MEKNNCPHYDYGKSADKALGAYCLLKKTCVEDCEGCDNEPKITVKFESAEEFIEFTRKLFGCEELPTYTSGYVQVSEFYAPQSE